jgi:hypothetical protein
MAIESTAEMVDAARSIARDRAIIVAVVRSIRAALYFSPGMMFSFYS